MAFSMIHLASAVSWSLWNIGHYVYKEVISAHKCHMIFFEKGPKGKERSVKIEYLPAAEHHSTSYGVPHPDMELMRAINRAIMKQWEGPVRTSIDSLGNAVARILVQAGDNDPLLLKVTIT